jgi:hypothetical protein
MKKYIEYWHKCLPYIVFASEVLFIFYSFLAKIKFGFLPYYGFKPKPSSLEYSGLKFTQFILELMSWISSPIWVFATLWGLIVYKRQFLFNKFSVVIFLFSVSVYLMFYFCFHDYYLWYHD